MLYAGASSSAGRLWLTSSRGFRMSVGEAERWDCIAVSSAGVRGGSGCSDRAAAAGWRLAPNAAVVGRALQRRGLGFPRRFQRVYGL